MNTISKTDFIYFIDSPRHLWAKKNGKIDENILDEYTKHLFDQGYEVEKYAEKYIRDLIIPKFTQSLDDFRIQPKFTDENFEARADCLVKNKETGKWDMYEIKSTNDIKKEHIYDVTFQYLVFSKGFDIGTVNIVHLNKEYVRGWDLNIGELFIVEDITETVLEKKDEVHNLRYEALNVLSETDSSKVLECIHPKSCPCLNICHPNLPEYSIYDINMLTGNPKKIRELVSLGIKSIYDVPSSFELSERQRKQVNAAINNEIVIENVEIKNELNSLKYPIYFIDYESYNPAIPMYSGFKPYDQMPFQWSLHVLKNENSVLEHFEYINMNMEDSTKGFLEELKKVVGSEGSIVVWNKSFEGTQNKRMSEIHPEFKEFCESMNNRMFDLMNIFKDMLYIDPKTKGSYSIKKVLPVLVSDLNYKELEINNGAVAMNSWFKAVYSQDDKINPEEIKKNLLKYCSLDTMAMIRIWEELNKLI